MIVVTDVFVKYGDRVLLDEINLSIKPKDKMGLVGRNGAGKSTIMKIISGLTNPDSGKVSRPSTSSIAYLHQDINIPPHKTVRELASSAFSHLLDMQSQLEELNNQISSRTDFESQSYLDLIQSYSDLTDQYILQGGESIDADLERVLKGLGFKDGDFDRKLGTFSGGWQMRVELAKMLLSRPDYLLLDEPTNHLDIESIIWLEKFLSNYEKAVILISHDQQFLNNVTKRIVEISLGKIQDYKAPYFKYLELRAERREKLQASFENQQKQIAQKERTITRFMAKASKTKMAQSMQKQLDKVERVEIDQDDTSTMRLRFPEAQRPGQVVVEAHDVVKKYGDLEVLNDVDFKMDRGDRVAFVGQNGQGKTTLAKLLIQRIPATSGDVKLGHNVSVGYYAQDQSDALDGSLTLLETMEHASPPEMRTQLRKVLGAFMFSGEDADKKVSVLSGGERARLALACMLLRPFNLLLLDEPTNHLDIQSKEVLKQALMDYEGSLIVVSHDRSFLKGLSARTIEFRDKQLHEYLGDIEYFLEKRKLDDMRAVELRDKKSKQAEAEKNTDSPLSFDERKKLNRIISNAERKIGELETKIADIEQLMADEK